MELDKRIVLITVSLSSFLTPFAGSSFNIALPSIGREYNLNALTMSWASLSYLLASAMLLIPFGKLADLYGRRRVYLYGVTLFTIASGLLPLYPSAYTLIGFRALMGVGSAMIFGTGVAILTSSVSAEERGSMLGVNVAVVYVGLSIGPFLGGYLTENLGWESIFYFNVLIGLISILLTLTKLRAEWKEEDVKKFDYIGSVLYSLTLLFLIYGISNIPSRESLLTILVGLILFSIFIVAERRIEHPVLDLQLFASNRAFSFGNLAALLNYSATFAITFLLSLYLQYIQGMNAQEAGLLMIASPIVQAVVSPVAGRLSDRVEAHLIAGSGMILTCLGIVPFIFLSETTTRIYIVSALGIVGMGLAMFSSPNTNAVMSSVDRKNYGVASSTLGTMRLTGQMISMAIVMMIFSLYLGSSEISPENYVLLLRSIKTGFKIFLIICIPGIGSSFMRNR